MTDKRQSQQGAALITMLLIAALAAALIVTLTQRQTRVLRELASQLEQDQLVEYARGATQFAMAALQADLDAGNAIDHPLEPWAQPFPPFPVPGGLVQPSVRDAQARFNLNAVVRDQVVDATAFQAFQRLLAQLQLPPELADSLVDWLDADSIPTGSAGAEDDFYQRLTPPYRAANRSLSTYSELRLVRGYDRQALTILAPYVTVLPERARTINVNFISPGLLEALIPGLSPATALEVLQSRPAEGWASVSAFFDSPAFSGLAADDRVNVQRLLDVQSRYFELYTRLTLSGRERLQWALIARGGRRQLRVIAEERNPLWMPDFSEASALAVVPEALLEEMPE